MNNFLYLTIIASAVGSGLMSGLFFTFSNFVMKSLANLPPNYGSSAMQSINISILNPSFLTIFLGTAISSIASLAIALFNWDQPGAGWVLGGAILYLGGCMVVTISCNVPLNNQLAGIDAESPTNFAVWQEYLARWNPWNHVRTVTTLAAAIAFIVALSRLNSVS